MVDIDTYNGPKRRFRGSIYVDYMVPETEDIEYDRKLAKEVMDYLRKKMEVESYVGGVGFRVGKGLNPFDMDF
jgi:multidrug efflux pump subunit AcrB